MAELFASMLRTRAFQFGAALFFTAALITTVDVTSLIVGNGPHQPPMPTRSSSPPIHITTMQPSSTPSSYFTDPVSIPDYEPTTSFPESSAVKKIYVLDYVVDQPLTGTPRPKASPKSPGMPFATTLTRNGSSADTSVPPCQSRMDEPSSQSPPTEHWIFKSIRDVLFEVKEYVLMCFPEMVAWFQIWRQIREITTTLNSNIMKLSAEKDREIEMVLEESEKSSKRAASAAEAAAAAKQNSDQQAAEEIARVRLIVQEGENALSEEQEASRQNLARAAEETVRAAAETARLLEEKSSTLENEKNSALEKEKERSSKALKEAKDDGSREATRLTGLAAEKNAETTARRKADKATIDDLKEQSVTDSNTIRELTKQVATIAEKDETVVTKTTETRKLRKEVKDLKEERDRALAGTVKAVKRRGDAEERATQLNTQVIGANDLRKAAEAKTLEKESLAAEAAKLQKVAEERATQEQNRAAEAEASCKTVKEKASQEEVRATEAVEQLKAKDERIATLEEQRQGKPSWSGTVAPSSDLSSQELSMLQQPRPIVRLPACPVPDVHRRSRTKGPFGAAIRPPPRWEPPIKSRTPPEERGLPANTPTGPKAGRVGRKI